MGGGKDKHVNDDGCKISQGFGVGQPHGNPPQGNTRYVHPSAPVPGAYPSGIYPAPMPGVHPPAQGDHTQSNHKYLETLGSIYSRVQEFLPHHRNGHSHLTSGDAMLANATIRHAQESIDCLGAVGCTTYEHNVSDNIGSSTTYDDIEKKISDARLMLTYNMMRRNQETFEQIGCL